MNIETLMELLRAKDNNAACGAMKTLQGISEECSDVYPYMDDFADMFDADNSYIRNRGLVLFAVNARWDTDNKVDEYIDSYLKHITDKKPITARQCIKMLPQIAAYKPDLREDIAQALQNADISMYADSMQPLVYKDIKEALGQIVK